MSRFLSSLFRAGKLHVQQTSTGASAPVGSSLPPCAFPGCVSPTFSNMPSCINGHLMCTAHRGFVGSCPACTVLQQSPIFSHTSTVMSTAIGFHPGQIFKQPIDEDEIDENTVIISKQEADELDELREWHERLKAAGVGDSDIEALLMMKKSGLTTEDIRLISVFKEAKVN